MEEEKKDTEAPAQERATEHKGMFDELFDRLTQREARNRAILNNK